MPDLTALSDLGESVALNAVKAAVATIALSKTAIQEDGTGITRPTAGTYADQAVTLGAITAGEPSTVANSAPVDFGDLEANETVTHYAALNAGGNVLFGGPLGSSVSYQSGVQDPLSFPANSLVLTLG